ncbi:esterase/lipase/thioesterase family protein [Novosphingobium sp. Rr 2-17]|uniref:hydrolase 1, exosortase A system-associated n=1 Tax=Novosphingobium sp. Rr 2-17 TaxID=555793 RepID=UPI00026991A6|nr:hydrolase 1, exosortase A system-associated [Novosphingobium sp. Rr 2-17]EIZ80374.1 esterase/lipase/thioesterase family protein [Novosphingobium sp. Rr 2-17]
MNRRHFLFPCEGSQLVGTIDVASGATALLIVSGGNEVRAGAWNGQARFAARIAAEGFPVLRFDRRGVGDSEGVNAGFRTSVDDINAACVALRKQLPHVSRIVALGNCDAASALMLAGGTGCDALVLSNPWTIESSGNDANGENEPTEGVRGHYRRRLADPAAIRRLLTGHVSIPKLARSLVAAARRRPTAPNGLAAQMANGLAGFGGPIRFLVAGRDRAGLAFLSHWNKADPRLRTCPQATHSYVEPTSQEWLVTQVLDVLRG